MAKKIENIIKIECITCYFGKDGKADRIDVKPEGVRTEGEIFADFKEKNPSLFDRNNHEESLENFQTILQVHTKFLDEKNRELSTKEFASIQRYLKILIHLFGNESINLSGEKIDKLLLVANRMPRGNIKPYSQMNISQRIKLAAANNVKKSDQVTNGKHALKAFQSFFSWLVQNRYLDSSPLAERRIKSKKGRKRAPFDIKQAQSIVDYILTHDNVSLKWSILIMAFSGMRNSEIENLAKSDIKKCSITKVWYFNITKSKSKAGVRRVPIAQILVDLGILDFIKSLQGEQIFRVSKRFMTTQYQNKIKPACRLPDENAAGEELCLYSFRHTVTSLLRSSGANEFYTMALMGHSGKGNIHNNYSHPSLIDLAELKRIIDKITDNYSPKDLK